MPIYDYQCTQCGAFDQMQSVAARHSALCPRCGEPAPRIRSGLPVVLTHTHNTPPAEDAAASSSGRYRCACCR
ncbi:FmdB family zinc ribbon protein [Paraburkholderia lacunae]|uniref:Zinc ribbon domain-containing protein n=1 Tax=Paraburkholderia lacunae TaxID=2211104 RepID=A0A370N0I3_9BURK|nr:zinc ribbon domain-containing protein [Paraburkholderia lacunae]